MKPRSFLTARALRSEKIRFGLVGVVNTSVDFIILFILARIVGIPVVAANMVSTVVAVGVSYILNKKAVFNNVDKQGIGQVAVFIVVTLAGLWGLQSLVIIGVTSVLAYIGNPELILFIAKILATVASLIWNYIWYSRVIFRKKHENKT